MTAVYLKPGRDKSVRRRHPWIFSGAIARMDGPAESGETVEIYSADGEALGKAAFSPHSSIRARMWTWDGEQEVDRAFLKSRLERAVRFRSDLVAPDETNAFRLVHAESDGIPGLIVDQYAEQLVIQVLSAGTEYWKNILIEELISVTGLSKVYERSDVEVRRLEGLEVRTETILGETPQDDLLIEENGLQFYVNVIQGQKTGFYLDQRQNRSRLRDFSAGKSVLNCFCYTGAFTVYALSGGAREVLSIDSSKDALQIGKKNTALNTLGETGATWLEGDVFKELRKLRDSRHSFDIIILDPPKFAPTAAQAERAARGYKDINLLAFKLLRPGGMLFTFSCSGGISADLFQKIVAGAALDAGVNANIVHYLQQGPDHPVSLAFPEGTYLKGLVCKVMG
jgi:23S rRNA (cytosine1962-C5)-methyltransferase